MSQFERRKLGSLFPSIQISEGVSLLYEKCNERTSFLRSAFDSSILTSTFRAGSGRENVFPLSLQFLADTFGIP